MPAIDMVLNRRFTYNRTELRYVLQQLHRHRRENWQISQDAAKAKADRRRKGTNSRRSDVSNFICKCIRLPDMSIKFHFIILRKKKDENAALNTCSI